MSKAGPQRSTLASQLVGTDQFGKFKVYLFLFEHFSKFHLQLSFSKNILEL